MAGLPPDLIDVDRSGAWKRGLSDGEGLETLFVFGKPPLRSESILLDLGTKEFDEKGFLFPEGLCKSVSTFIAIVGVKI